MCLGTLNLYPQKTKLSLFIDRNSPQILISSHFPGHSRTITSSPGQGESAVYFGHFQDALAVSSHTRRVVDAWFSERRRIVAMLWPSSGTHGRNMAGALRSVRRQKPHLQRQDPGLNMKNVGNLKLP